MLVNCVVYRAGKKLADISAEAISDYLKDPENFIWVAIKDPADGELDSLREEFGLHPLAVEDARNGHQRPKIEEYGDSLFVVLHMIEPDGPDLRVGEVDIFVGPNYVLSVRNRAEKGFQDVRARCEREPELLRNGSGYVLYALMDAVVDRYFPVLETLENELEAIEERIFDNTSPRGNIESLYALKQRLMLVKHAVAPLLESTGNLTGGRVPSVCNGIREYFRDIYDHLLRLNQEAENIRETIGTAISVNLSMIQLQENDTMKRLAAYGALIAVPTLIAGIYGMNFTHMPELDWKYGYGLAVGIMAAIDGAIFYRLRKARWI